MILNGEGVGHSDTNLGVPREIEITGLPPKNTIDPAQATHMILNKGERGAGLQENAYPNDSHW
jgi:hypothetical protein